MTDELAAEVQTHLAGSYAVERELGGGGMSRVFLARDERLDRRVVIKVLPPSLAATVSVDRFRREIMLAASLQHPHVVPVLAAGEVGALPYFVMPYIAGESLRARITRGPLSVREAVSVLSDVARALAFAHERGIVHRDIKPDNILVSSGSAMVTDFGVAKALDVARRGPNSSPNVTGRVSSGGTAITGFGISLGTPAYMAPEQAAADPNVDHRADIYSFGVVAYELLVGAPPFAGRSPQALLAAQLSETPAPIASRRYDIPVALAELIGLCLQKDPSRRPRTASEMVKVLESPDAVSGVFATPPSARKRRPKKAIAAAIAATAVVALALVAWRLTTPEEEVQPLPLPALSAPVYRSLAVLPLGIAGGDSAASGIAAGLTSELTNAMSGITGLRVASQSAASATIAGARGPGDVGRALGVALLLEGTVQRAGPRVRVTMRLVSVAEDSTLWADRFEGAASDIFAVQDSLVRAAVTAVSARTQ